MKIQCSCGAKYVFEVTPDMLEKPVRFVCTSCGLDASEYVNNLVREELGQAPAEGAHDSARASLPAGEISGEDEPREFARAESCAPSGIAAGVASSAPLRVRHAPDPAKSEAPAPAESETCSKHYGVRTVARCYICSKPIC